MLTSFDLDQRPARADIAQSWQRALACGLRPDQPLDRVTPSEVDRGSRLMLAAAPVLGELTGWLAGTQLCLLLADRSARIVDRRFSDARLESHLDGIGAVLGNTFTEETSGTNSIATAFELRRGVIVNGAEHFMEPMKKFSCYGRPLLHPVGRRVEGVLQISGLSEQMSPLWIPIIDRASRDIEDRLMAGARRAEQQMLMAYQDACSRGDRPVVVLGENIVLANPTAIDLLDITDYGLLKSLAENSPFDSAQRTLVTFASGRESQVAFGRITGATSGVLFEMTPVVSRAPVPRGVRPSASTGDELTDELVRYRQARTRLLVAGEPGSGRSALTRELAGDLPVDVIDAAEIGEQSIQRWIDRLAQAAVGTDHLVVVEGIHLLPPAAAERAGQILKSAPAWFAMTSCPVAEMEPVHAALGARCSARIELVPLRFRREELSSLVRSMVQQIEPGSAPRFDAALWEVLMNHPWPDNLHELKTVITHLLSDRNGDNLTVQDLPSAYRGSRKGRMLSQLEQAEHDTIVRALRACQGNKVRTASELGIGRTTLYKRIRYLGIAI